MGLTKLSIAALGLVGGATAALEPIQMKGQKFFYKNGTQFFMKGIAYQEGVGAAGEGAITDGNSDDYLDPLSNQKKCARDVPLLEELGVNTIRTYAIDPTKNHDACMKMLDDAGIYVISDLSQPNLSINRDDPQWTTELLKRYTDVVDSLAPYSNVIGFFAGNEVSNNKTNTGASAYVKAAVRDTKSYIKQNHPDRWLGVGYATNDDTEIRVEMAQYFNCGDKETTIDYWGYNIYSWCSPSNMKDSGYSAQVDFFSNFSIPVFFAEYGCNKPNGADGRTFDETAALYSDAMTGVFSGGLVYMYFNETNDYGVVQVKGDKANKMDNFEALAKQHAKAKPKGVDIDSYTPANNPPSSCPGISSSWKVSSEALPPVADSNLCDCMEKTRECVPSDSLDSKDFGDIFGFICEKDKDGCKAINGEPEIGVYGAYSMCTPKQKLAYVMDSYYKKLNRASDACDFSGAAKTQSAQSDSKCTDQLKEADDHNKQVATATAANDAPASTGKGKDDEPGFGIRSAPLARVFSIGDVAVGLYMVVAMGVGAGMALL